MIGLALAAALFAGPTPNTQGAYLSDLDDATSQAFSHAKSPAEVAAIQARAVTLRCIWWNGMGKTDAAKACSPEPPPKPIRSECTLKAAFESGLPPLDWWKTCKTEWVAAETKQETKP